MSPKERVASKATSPKEYTGKAALLFEIERAQRANRENEQEAQASSSTTDNAAIETASTAGTEDSDGGIPVNEIGLNNLVIDDTQRAIPVRTESNGAYHGPARSTTTERHGRAFVEGAIDDPFRASPSKRTPSFSADRVAYSGVSLDLLPSRRTSSHGTPSSQRHPAHIMSNWRSGRSSSDDSPARARGTIEPQVSSQNAQAHFPPSACVFVANLLQTEDESKLEYFVTRAFSKFGPVWVKIRRDPKGMPYAFCQYTCDEDATRAIIEGRGLLIHGRPVRTEKAKANRTFLMSRRFGEDLTVEEARLLLEKFGKIERAWLPSETDIFMFQLARGAFVTFALYESGKEALNAYKDHPVYHLQSINFQTNSPKLEKSDESGQWMNSYDYDRNTIFVGNLPPNATQFTVSNLFHEIGQIRGIEIVRRPSVREGSDLHVFAFVEFESPTSASRAIRTMHNYHFEGFLLKVAPKEPAHNRDDRTVRNQHPHRRASIYQSPEYMYHQYGYGYAPPATPMSYGGFTGYMPPHYPVTYPYWPGSPGYSTAPAPAPAPATPAASYWSAQGIPPEYIAAQYYHSPTGYYSADYVQPGVSENRAGTPTPVMEPTTETEPTLQ